MLGIICYTGIKNQHTLSGKESERWCRQVEKKGEGQIQLMCVLGPDLENIKSHAGVWPSVFRTKRVNEVFEHSRNALGFVF
jgi:hypothetical protein